MAQIRQRHVNIQVTSEDPTNKVFKGIYADSEHTMLLSSNKSYEFDINSGQSRELYIRYSQKPVTIIFKGVAKGSYKVTGNFGEVNVSSEDVTANVEFLTDTSPYVDVTFSSIDSTTEGYEIGDMRVGGALIHSLPYYLQNVVPGQQIEVNVEIGETTTTTTKLPVTLTFTAFPKNPANPLYANMVVDDGTGISRALSSGYLVISDIRNKVNINSIATQDNNFRYLSVNIKYTSGNSTISSETLSIPCTIDLTDSKFASYRPSDIEVTPGEYVDEGGSVITTTTTSTTSTTSSTSTPAPAVLKLQSNTDGTVVQVTSDGIYPNPSEVSLAGTTQSSVVIDMKDAPLVDA